MEFNMHPPLILLRDDGSCQGSAAISADREAMAIGNIDLKQSMYLNDANHVRALIRWLEKSLQPEEQSK